MKKKCVECEQEFPMGSFHKAGRDACGRQKYHPKCKSCRKPEIDEGYERRREKCVAKQRDRREAAKKPSPDAGTKALCTGCNRLLPVDLVEAGECAACGGGRLDLKPSRQHRKYLHLEGPVTEALKERGDWSSRRIAEANGWDTHYVESVRVKLELAGEIPIATEVFWKDGRKARRRPPCEIDPYVRSHMVYFFQEVKGTRYVKIGYTYRGVYLRLKQLNTARPQKLVVLAGMSGDEKVESGLHERFVAHRVPGGTKEWFYPHPDLMGFIDEVSRTHPLIESNKNVYVQARRQACKGRPGLDVSGNPHAILGKKKCEACGEVLSMRLFRVYRHNPDHLDNVCTVCKTGKEPVYAAAAHRAVIQGNIRAAHTLCQPS